MADLEPGGETVTEDVVAPVVAPEAEIDANVETVADPVETLARELGWSDKTKWHGDEAKFKDAATFIRDTGKIKDSLYRDLKGMKETLSGVSRVTESIVADRVAERDAYWQQQHAKAVEAGDSDAALEAARNLTAPKPQVTVTPPETSDFVSRNASWFQKNPLATDRAIQVTEMLAKAGYSVADQLAEAEKRVKIEFPDLFPKEVKPAPSVAAPTARVAATNTREKGVNDLPPAALAVAKDMHERLGVPVEQFAKNYWADKAKELAK